MDTVDVIVPTFGDTREWEPLAKRAIRSVYNQTVRANHTFYVEGKRTLSYARNRGAADSSAEWLIFLDADDELDPHYIEEMLAGEGDIRQPSTLGFVNGRPDDYPVLIPPQPNFMVGNHLVIGSMMRRSFFVEVGGFRDLPVLEDWDLFIRMQLAGAKLGICPKAIYRVHVQPASRNTNSQLHGEVYQQIQQRYQQEWFSKGLR